jgi:hypothetical protein
MRKKQDNNLIMMTVEGEKKYFTSMNRAGIAAGLSAGSIKWAIQNNSVLKNYENKNVTFEIVDGSEIPYKYINN